MTFCYPCRAFALLTRGFTSFMSGWPRIYYKLLNLPLSILVKSKSIPADPAPELGLDTGTRAENSRAECLADRQWLAIDGDVP
ncbi:hypothetical protein E2K66_08190 [Escherichia coli]|nr:hypothetical protein E2K66_08190 [Escherichia coli]